jgi:hypothetical protein
MKENAEIQTNHGLAMHIAINDQNLNFWLVKGGRRAFVIGCFSVTLFMEGIR